AVALARVTYLLAIGPDRLAAAPRPLRVPITLGDSMQWDRAPPDPALPAPAKMDLLIGNPPWLAYRHMPAELQANFRVMSKARGLWRGARVATHQDLSALFVTRAIELYLNHGGRFAFVMPGAVLDREQYQGFRSGSYLPDLHAA